MSELRRYLWIGLSLLVFSPVGAERLKGDLNGDGQVNFTDFLLMSQNFGRIGGDIFDPIDYRDTIHIADTIRIHLTDTLYIYPVGHVHKPDPIYSISWVGFTPFIYFDDEGDWGESGGRQILAVIYHSIMGIFEDVLIQPLDSDIFLKEFSEEESTISHSRHSTGAHIIRMPENPTHPDDWAKHAHEFAHRYARILMNYYQTPGGSHKWFEEAIAETASLYALRMLAIKSRDPIYLLPNAPYWLSGHLMRYAEQFNVYAAEIIKGKKVSDKDFKAWFQDNRSALEENHLLRDKSMFIAHNLIEVFQDQHEPEVWNTLRYLNIRGPLTWEMEHSFETYFHGWWLRTPRRWQKYVERVAHKFGIDPMVAP